jgi:hypothetical protein
MTFQNDAGGTLIGACFLLDAERDISGHDNFSFVRHAHESGAEPAGDRRSSSKNALSPPCDERARG